ncbi:MAG: hypothetical protein KA230_08835, partial [Flavobacteriales bacterium]|nr:hypothetical protein [Flavobacteriales bacterium]
MRCAIVITFLFCVVGQVCAQLELVGESDATTVRVRGVEHDGTLDGPYFQATWRFTDDGTTFDLLPSRQPDGTMR